PGGRRAPWIAVVGSRKATPYGRSTARRISHDLCVYGCVVVSGMAAGVDSYAHRGALDAGGPTVAVLGTGVDVAYPRENARVLDETSAAGAVVSEYGMGEGPEPWHFPIRNRIISGMCEGTVVVEAGESSGALITADLALEQGREVMAVPGQAGSAMSRGTNRLIKMGAALVESAEDVLEALGIDAAAAPVGTVRDDAAAGPVGPVRGAAGREEQAVLSLLDNGPSTIDKICEGTSLPPSAVVPLLTNLELRGLVERMDGAVYCRRR
ncbi:MAG: DNA-processing protein DprA, partial [Ignavibacteriales bacterium]